MTRRLGPGLVAVEIPRFDAPVGCGFAGDGRESATRLMKLTAPGYWSAAQIPMAAVPHCDRMPWLPGAMALSLQAGGSTLQACHKGCRRFCHLGQVDEPGRMQQGLRSKSRDRICGDDPSSKQSRLLLARSRTPIHIVENADSPISALWRFGQSNRVTTTSKVDRVIEDLTRELQGHGWGKSHLLRCGT